MRKPPLVEAILWAIGVRGPAAAFDYVKEIWALLRNEFTSFMDVRHALEDAGMERTDIMELALGRHQASCACWTCVMALNMEVRKGIARAKARQECSNDT